MLLVFIPSRQSFHPLRLLPAKREPVTQKKSLRINEIFQLDLFTFMSSFVAMANIDILYDFTHLAELFLTRF